jgi:hypothetical protein
VPFRIRLRVQEAFIRCFFRRSTLPATPLQPTLVLLRHGSFLALRALYAAYFAVEHAWREHPMPEDRLGQKGK